MTNPMYETIELNLSDEEQQAICATYVKQHFRPESVSLYDDMVKQNPHDYQIAVVNAIINESTIHALMVYIEEQEKMQEEGA